MRSATNEKAASYCQNLHIQPSTQSVLNIQLWEQEEKHIYDRRGTLTPHGFQQEGKAAGVKTVLCLAGLSLRRCLRNSTDPDLLLFPCGLSFSLDVVWEVAIGTNGLAAACHVTPGRKAHWPCICCFSDTQLLGDDKASWKWWRYGHTTSLYAHAASFQMQMTIGKRFVTAGMWLLWTWNSLGSNLHWYVFVSSCQLRAECELQSQRRNDF